MQTGKGEAETLVRNAAGVAVAAYGDDRGTAERRQHDDVETVDTFEGGKRARAARAGDTVGRLLKNGTITGGMAKAARRFQADFHIAGLDPMRCMPLERMPGGGGGGETDRAMDARAGIAAVMKTMGGHGSPAGAALWFVLGCGCSIREWAQRERLGAGASMNEHTAKGILIGALSALEAWEDKAG